MKPTESQRDTLAELEALAEQDAAIRLVDSRGVTADGDLVLSFTLDTSTISVVDGGLPVGDEEAFVAVVDRDYPWSPPTACVEHRRFAEHAHVISGGQLCVFLDPDREWHHSSGMAGFLSALWDFLVEGAAGKFDAATALFHPVGGAVRTTAGTPLAVVRELNVPSTQQLFRVAIVDRNLMRVDVGDWVAGTLPGVGLVPRKRLTYGTGRTVAELFGVVAYPDMRGFQLPPCPPPQRIRHRFAVAAAHTEPGTPVYFVIAAPNPAVTGTHHLLCGRIPVEGADRLRAAVRRVSAARITEEDLPNDTMVEWCSVSDERPGFVMRRDARRPVSHLDGASVELWGCGGLGSWLGEFLVRAGVGKLVVRDRGRVAGGLLVRQNYTDADVGWPKALALAERLAALSDGTEVVPSPEPISDLVAAGGLPECDLLIDATVSNTVLEILGLVWQGQGPRPLVARVATDSASATLGHVVVSSRGSSATPTEIDDAAGTVVLADPELERFHCFWKFTRTDELIPAPGCSLPTYHGSAADLAVIAGSMLNVIASHLPASTSGVHLLAAPLAVGSGPAHRFVESLLQ